MLQFTSSQPGSTQGADAVSLGSGPMEVLFLIATSCPANRKLEPLNHQPKALMSECVCVCLCVCVCSRRVGQKRNRIILPIPLGTGSPHF